MTGLLKLHVKTTWTLKEDSYRQRNNIYEQMVKRTNKEKQDTSLQNNRILLEVKWTCKMYK